MTDPLLRTESTEVPVLSSLVPNQAFHLVVAWSSEQPELVGHTAQVRGASVLGRGGPRREEAQERRRMVFASERPSGPVYAPPLEGSRLSRRQLLLEPSEDRATLAVTSVGRCPLLLNGDGKGLDLAAMQPGLVDALLRHDYTHHVRELNRLLWLALASGRPGRLGLTAELRAELRTEREPAFGPEGPGRADIEAALAKCGGKVTPAARLLRG